MQDDEKLQVARRLIQNLLAGGPMKGATLKLRLLGDFESESGEAFDTAFRAYFKFSNFLAANSDLVEIQRPDAGTPGDITVRLRAQAPNAIAAHSDDARELFKSPDRYLPRDIWQALTNPDPKRRRFLNQNTREVRHFLEDQPINGLASDRNWIEIKPVPATVQADWMRRFALSGASPPNKRDDLLAIAALPYSTTTNALFNKALAGSAQMWRRFRAVLIVNAAQEWCQKVGISFEGISQPAPSHAEKPSGTSQEGSLRDTLIEVIKAASLEELLQITIPASLLRFRKQVDGH